MSDERLNIRITGYEPDEPIAGVQRIAVQTTRGVIPLLLHSASDKARSVVCISGAIGGFDGPAKLYPRLGLRCRSMESASRGSITASPTTLTNACSIRLPRSPFSKDWDINARH